MAKEANQSMFVVIVSYVNWSKHGAAGQRVFSGTNEVATHKQAAKWIRKSTHCEIIDTDSYWADDGELSDILRPKY